MDLASALFGPGLVGGLFVALWLVLAHRRARAGDQTVAAPTPLLLVDPINAARIRVAGIGGLGLLAMAAVVAAFVPAIRVSLSIAAVAGVALAIGLIAWRRRAGPLPSSGQTPGAATIFALESPDAAAAEDRQDRALGVTRTTPRLRTA